MKMTMKNASLVSVGLVALLFVIALGVSYMTTAGLTWLIMYGLTAIGVTLPIVWSWWLAAVVWFVLFLLGSIFGRS
jgi:hypothetical protein